MNSKNAKILQELQDLDITLEILIGHLLAADSDKSHEAVTVLLFQALDKFGAESAAMKQFFPVLDTIKSRIDANQLEGALGQTRSFQSQLKEVMEIVSK